MLLPIAKTLDILQQGEIVLQGEFIWGSNYTFLTRITLGKDELLAVYKPSKGERPLWDFPSASLAKREVAAFWVSEQLGWKFVPPTVYREDCPLGPGSLQLYIEHNPEYHYFTFSREDIGRLRPVALFDILINNADRKGSHILIGEDKRLWLIDHGVCFHVEDKLRTVIWDFVDEPIPESYCQDIHQFIVTIEKRGDAYSVLAEWIKSEEIDAMIARGEKLLKSGVFPRPSSNKRHIPWPQI